MPQGLYRILGRPNWVLVQYADFDAAEREEFYSEQGFDPQLSELPWSEDYDHSEGDDQPSGSRVSQLYRH